jgi:hypothetical protein
MMRLMRETPDQPVALVDMDETWLQWGTRLNEILLGLDPSHPVVDNDKRNGYTNLEPVPFAVESILEMVDEGWDVHQCSTRPGPTMGAFRESSPPSTSTSARLRGPDR